MATRMVQAQFNSIVVPQLVVNTLGSLAALVIASALWLGGAASTVVLATSIIAAISGSVGAWWPWYAIGILFSVVEIWDRRVVSGPPNLKKLAGYVTNLDTLTTTVGLYIVTMQYLMPLFVKLCTTVGLFINFGNQIVSIVTVLIVVLASAVVGRWLTCKPEEFAIEAVEQLYHVGKYVLAVVRKQPIAVTVPDKDVK